MAPAKDNLRPGTAIACRHSNDRIERLADARERRMQASQVRLLRVLL